MFRKSFGFTDNESVRYDLTKISEELELAIEASILLLTRERCTNVTIKVVPYQKLFHLLKDRGTASLNIKVRRRSSLELLLPR